VRVLVEDATVRSMQGSRASVRRRWLEVQNRHTEKAGGFAVPLRRNDEARVPFSRRCPIRSKWFGESVRIDFAQAANRRDELQRPRPRWNPVSAFLPRARMSEG